MKRLVVLSLTLLLMAACQTETASTSEETAATETPSVPVGYAAYGETITPDDALAVESVVAEVEAYVGKEVKIEGTVAEVCQAMGCWMILRAGDEQTIRLNVPRNEEGNYVYTVPTDISGRTVIVEGTLEEATLSVEEQQHLAEDAGETLGDDIEPVRELQMIPRGVLVAQS